MTRRGKGKEAPAKSSRLKMSPRRTRSVSQHEEEPLEHELELESLIQLNLEAASGELPSQQVLESHYLSALNAPVDSQSVAQTSSVNESAVAPVRPTQEIVRKPRRQQQINSQKPLATTSFGPSFLPLTTDEEENPDETSVALRPRVVRDDQEALDALVGSFQSFISNDDIISHADCAFPLALPAPVSGVAEQSALKEFRDAMIDRHKECEVPPPEHDDLARLFAELPDGQGVHIQLPALAFPKSQKDARFEGQYVLVGSLVLDRSSGSAQIVSVSNSRRLRFEVAQHNVPSLLTEVFAFHHTKTETETGSVRMQAVEFPACLAGSMKFAENSHDDGELSRRRDSVLEEVIAEKKSVLERNAERKRKLEEPPAETRSAKASEAVSGQAVKRPKRKVDNVPEPVIQTPVNGQTVTVR